MVDAETPRRQVGATFGPAMTPGLLTVAGLSLLLGFRHAFEPDHLAAVSTLATRQGSVLRASWLGIVWGLGHTASVGVVALLVIGAGLSLPQRLWPAADFLVGMLLVALGAAVLWRYARGRWDLRRSLGFGLLHGLAGSGAIVVLLIATVPTRGAQLAYLGAFGLGTMVGMLAVSLSLAALVRLASRRGALWATVLHLGSAAASISVGLVLAWRMADAL